MEALLVKRNCWTGIIHVIVPNAEAKDEETVERELATLLAKRDSTKLSEARAELILRVDDSQLAHMRSRDPREIWLTLQRVHRAAGFTTSLALQQRFLTTKMGAKQTMQSWIGAVKTLAFRLEESGTAVSDQDIILALTMGLPATYDAVIINFDATATELLTLEYVISRLLNEETRQESAADRISIKEEEPDEAMAVSSGYRGRRGPTDEPTCYFCDQKGHFKSECPDRLKWDRYKKQPGYAGAATALDSDSDGGGIF